MPLSLFGDNELLNRPLFISENNIAHSQFSNKRVLPASFIYELAGKMNTMNKFKIVPLPKKYADSLKSTMIDDFGNEITEKIATGHGPCRVSLKPFIPGRDKRLLLSHSPFTVKNAFNQPGPIFISSDDVEEYADVHRFPPAIKNDREHFHLTLIGYDSNQQMVHSELVGNNDIDKMIERLFDSKASIEYLHARSAEACCFICKIERT